jgi:hypothetical protein
MLGQQVPGRVPFHRDGAGLPTHRTAEAQLGGDAAYPLRKLPVIAGREEEAAPAVASRIGGIPEFIDDGR